MSWRLALRGVGIAVTSSIVAVACAQGDSDLDFAPMGTVDPDSGAGGADGSRLPASDSGASDASRPDSEPTTTEDCPAPTACTGNVVINELMTRGPGGAGEEFVELYNPNTCAVSLGGWKLGYRSKTGTGNGVLHTFDAGDSIAAGAFLVLGTSSFSGTKDATMNSGMADEGQIGLVDEGGTTVDAVGYGATSGPFIEGTPTSGPPPSGSIGRNCGVDTDDNAVDFETFAQHSAGAANL